MKRFLCFILLCVFFDAQAGLKINEFVTATDDDWVELKLSDGSPESMDISSLYVTMYYGTNEALAGSPVTIRSTDISATPYDDRYVVVHLNDPLTPDETDITGDTNQNGWLDLYCSNYSGSLWNTDGLVSIDSDDDPANGGIIDFVCYSNRDGSPNSTISSYVEDAVNYGAWTGYTSGDMQGSAVYIGPDGLGETDCVSRTGDSDTDHRDDFRVSKFQTPGRDNLVSPETGGRVLFRPLKKRVLCSSGADGVREAIIPLLVLSECKVTYRVCSMIGTLIHEPRSRIDAVPGYLNIKWKPGGKIPGGYITLLPVQIEACSNAFRKTEQSIIYIIVSGK